MIQEFRQCVYVLKNLEKDVESLVSKCEEVKKQHIQDTQRIKQLEEENESLKEKLKAYETK